MRGGLAQALRDLDHGREFRPLQLIDPYGLVTTYSYGSSTATLPSQVTDVTGRWLRFTGPNARLINRVESSAGQWIQWTRDYQPGKSKVDYWDGTTAYYEGGSISTTQRWVRFSDVRQTSSMRDVEYRLVLAPYGQFGPEVGVWEVVEEKHPVSGTVVSTRSVSTRKQFLEGVGAVATGPAINVTESRGDGPTRNFTFDDNYRLSSATNFRGHRSYFSNWHGGVPRTITDARGHITTLQTSGPYAKITRITHPDNNYIEYTWDGRYLTGERNENGYWTYYDRDAQKRVWRIRHRDSASETFEYNSRNQMTKHVLRSGAAEHWTYNSAGLVHRYWPPTTAGAVTTAPYFEYTYYSSRTSKDLVQTARDPRGNITTYEYNARGQVTKETFADSKYRAYGYDNWGNRLWAEDEDRRRTNYTYDVYNRLLTTTDPLNRAVTHTYEPMSAGSSLKHTRAAIRRTTTHANRKTAFVYDNDYNVVEEVRGEGTADSAKVTMQYDQVGNRTRLTQQVEGTTTRVTNYEFDSRSRRTKEFAPLSRTTQWEHDPAGNVLKVTYPDGTFTSTTYHSMDRVLTQTDERGYLTRYTYHASGMVNSIIDPRLNAHTHTYDSAHRLLSRTYPGGSVESWTYDKAGNVATYTNRSGHVQNFTYNTRNRETRKWWNGVVAPEVNTTYDAVGRVLTKINTHSALSYTYDVAGQLLTEAQSVTGRPAVTLTYGYDGDGLRNSFSTTAGQALTYGYTGRSLLKEVKRGTVTVASYTYNLADQRRIRTYANGTASDYNYDAAGRMNYLHTYRPADGSWVVMHRYGHDLRDRRTWSLRSEGFGDTYEYFPDGQLQRYRHMVNRPDQNFNNPAAWTDTFAYDENGNRTSLNENGTVRTFQANTLNQYTSVSGNTLSYTDGRGNQTGWNGWTYTYDAENRLTGAQMSGTSLAFAYDPTGRLVKVTKNGTAEYRYYDGSQCFLRTNGSGTQIDWTIWGSTPDEVLAREDSANGGWQYYHQDMINSVFAVTNTAAGVIERYLYDPFGEPDIRDGSWNPRAAIAIGNPWLFTGQEWRSDLNLSNYKGRWYHPALGRFLQNDPIRFDGGDLNLYRYVDNNPINAVDPDGQFAFLIGAAIGALADTAVQLVNNGGDVKKLNVGSIAASAALGATGVGLGKVAAKVTAQLAISQGAKLAARAAINGAGGAALGAGDASIRNAVSGTNNDVGLAALVGGAGGAVGSALGDVVEAGVNKALTGAAPGKLTQELIDNGQLSGPFTKPISDAPGDLANVATSAGISSATKGVDIDPDKK